MTNQSLNENLFFFIEKPKKKIYWNLFIYKIPVPKADEELDIFIWAKSTTAVKKKKNIRNFFNQSINKKKIKKREWGLFINRGVFTNSSLFSVDFSVISVVLSGGF